MATTTVTRVYGTYEKATQIVRELEAAEIPHGDISIVSSNKDDRYSNLPQYKDISAEKSEGEVLYETAASGGLIGAGAGLLAGLGLVAIPGLGIAAAAGWLAAMFAGGTIGAVVGAAAEGISDALSGHGVSKEDATRYAEDVRLGGTLVAVKVDSSKTALTEAIMGESDSMAADRRVA